MNICIFKFAIFFCKVSVCICRFANVFYKVIVHICRFGNNFSRFAHACIQSSDYSVFVCLYNLDIISFGSFKENIHCICSISYSKRSHFRLKLAVSKTVFTTSTQPGEDCLIDQKKMNKSDLVT